MKYALCSILLLYFFFASGIAYELATPMLINKIEAPYSIGLSAERTGIMPIANEDDIQALKWLQQNAQGRKIVSDYNGYLLVHGFMQNHVDNLRYGDLTHINKGDLIFLSSWNIKNQKYIEGAGGVGVRTAYPFTLSAMKYCEPVEGEINLSWVHNTLKVGDSCTQVKLIYETWGARVYEASNEGIVSEKPPFGLTVEQWEQMMRNYEVMRRMR